VSLLLTMVLRTRLKVTLYVNCPSRDILSGTTDTPCSLAFLTTEFHKGLKQQNDCNDQPRGHPVRQYDIHTHNQVERRSLNNRDTLRFNQRSQKKKKKKPEHLCFWTALLRLASHVQLTVHYTNRKSPQICSNSVQMKVHGHATETVPLS
jgi:hypothetical protein